MNLLTMLAWAQAFDRQFDASISNFKKAIELDPNSAEALATYSLVLPFVGEFEEARVIYEKALELDPFGHPNGDVLIGRHHLFRGEYESALVAFKRAADRTPGFKPANLHMAMNGISAPGMDP